MTRFNEWRVVHEPERALEEEHYRIYSVPKHEPGLDTFPRLVAKLGRKEDADLIVTLYEAHRKEHAS